MKEGESKQLFKKIHGSWTGKVIGSLYGMPFEGKDPRELEASHGQIAGWQAAHGTGGGVINDDEQFELVALLCMEQEGIQGFTVPNLSRYWSKYLNPRWLFTAEKQVYENWAKGIPPEEAAKPGHNPWFDFIGAQMKGEIFGHVAKPGDLQTAVDLARVDGLVAHDGIGVDGELFIAGMVNLGINSNKLPHQRLLREHVNTVKQYLAPGGKYAELVDLVLGWSKENPEPRGWEVVFTKVEQWWQEETLESLILEEEARPTHPQRRQVLMQCALSPWSHCHVLPNAGIILIALLYGNGDFGQSLQLAATMGYDADCNVGNVGGILGAHLGQAGIPEYWKQQIEDEILVVLKDWEDPSLTNLARRVLHVARNRDSE